MKRVVMKCKSNLFKIRNLIKAISVNPLSCNDLTHPRAAHNMWGNMWGNNYVTKSFEVKRDKETWLAQ